MNEVQNIINQQKIALIIPDGIAVIGVDRKIIVFNEAASRVTGFTEDETIGRNCSMLFNETSEESKFITETISEKRVYSNLPFKIKERTGKFIDVLASITPILKS